MKMHEDIRRTATRWPVLLTIGAAALLAAACSRERDRPAAPDAAGQQPAAPPRGPGPGYGMGPGPHHGPGYGMGPGPHHGHGMGPGGPHHGPGMGPDSWPAALCTMGSGPLSDEARDAVLRALDDEREAEAEYTAIMTQLGQAAPFSRIRWAEQRHSAALERILAAHGVPIPAEKPAAAPVVYPDVAAACRAGAESEKANIAMYDTLSKVPLPEDVQCVFSHLRAASETRHLPAFQRCSGSP